MACYTGWIDGIRGCGQKAISPRLEFEAAAIYEYPEHLRPWLEALPKLPGVYQFHGDSDTMPLYIGKSVNLRSRVLSHLRTPEEAAMLRQSRRITAQRTAGELERCCKRRGVTSSSARLLADDRPQIVYAREVDFSHQQHLYGLFANRRAALQMLQSLADEQRLCYGLLGLEPLSRGRAAFARAGPLRRGLLWKGGVEAHRERLLAQMSRLQLVCWPWAGPVALEERGPDMTQYHVIHNWLWLGAVESLDRAAELTRLPAGFDRDGYKILCKPLLSGDYPLHPLAEKPPIKPPALPNA